MYKLIAFDYDGTLVDTVYFHTELLHHILTKYNKDITRDEIKIIMGKSINEIFKNKLNEFEFKKCIEEIDNHFKNIPLDFWQYIKVVPNAISTLSNLKSMGIKIAIVSNSHYELLKESVKRTKLNDVVDIVIGADIKTPMQKCDRLKETLKYFNVNAYETLYVGDTSTDIRDAKNIKMHNCLIYNNTSWINREDISIDDIKPEFIINDISKLLNIL